MRRLQITESPDIVRLWWFSLLRSILLVSFKRAGRVSLPFAAFRNKYTLLFRFIIFWCTNDQHSCSASPPITSEGILITIVQDGVQVKSTCSFQQFYSPQAAVIRAIFTCLFPGFFLVSILCPFFKKFRFWLQIVQLCNEWIIGGVSVHCLVIFAFKFTSAERVLMGRACATHVPRWDRFCKVNVSFTRALQGFLTVLWALATIYRLFCTVFWHSKYSPRNAYWREMTSKSGDNSGTPATWGRR